MHRLGFMPFCGSQWLLVVTYAISGNFCKRKRVCVWHCLCLPFLVATTGNIIDMSLDYIQLVLRYRACGWCVKIKNIAPYYSLHFNWSETHCLQRVRVGYNSTNLMFKRLRFINYSKKFLGILHLRRQVTKYLSIYYCIIINVLWIMAPFCKGHSVEMQMIQMRLHVSGWYSAGAHHTQLSARFSKLTGPMQKNDISICLDTTTSEYHILNRIVLFKLEDQQYVVWVSLTGGWIVGYKWLCPSVSLCVFLCVWGRLKWRRQKR